MDTRIEALRRIVSDGQMRRVEGQFVDIFTASHVLTVYDALGPANREKFSGYNINQMDAVTWKLLKVEK